MKRVFLGELLQTIYLDVSVYENSYMYIHKINNDEMYKTTYIAKKHNLEDILNDLYKQIHPRYTKVIIDCGIVNNKMIKNIIITFQRWINLKLIKTELLKDYLYLNRC